MGSWLVCIMKDCDLHKHLVLLRYLGCYDKLNMMLEKEYIQKFYQETSWEVNQLQV